MADTYFSWPGPPIDVDGSALKYNAKFILYDGICPIERRNQTCAKRALCLTMEQHSIEGRVCLMNEAFASFGKIAHLPSPSPE